MIIPLESLGRQFEPNRPTFRRNSINQEEPQTEQSPLRINPQPLKSYLQNMTYVEPFTNRKLHINSESINKLSAQEALFDDLNPIEWYNQQQDEVYTPLSKQVLIEKETQTDFVEDSETTITYIKYQENK